MSGGFGWVNPSRTAPARGQVRGREPQSKRKESFHLTHKGRPCVCVWLNAARDLLTSCWMICEKLSLTVSQFEIEPEFIIKGSNSHFYCVYSYDVQLAAPHSENLFKTSHNLFDNDNDNNNNTMLMMKSHIFMKWWFTFYLNKVYGFIWLIYLLQIFCLHKSTK